MAIDPPYRLDPLQNPTDVKWGEFRPTWTWTFTLNHGSPGTLTCSIAGSLVPYETSLSLTLLSSTPPAGWSFSGAPSVSPDSFTYAENEFAGGVHFLEALESGNGAGSAIFELVGLECGGGVVSVNAGTTTVTVPSITLTITDPETEVETEYVLAEWEASALAGLTVVAIFELSGGP